MFHRTPKESKEAPELNGLESTSDKESGEEPVSSTTVKKGCFCVPFALMRNTHQARQVQQGNCTRRSNRVASSTPTVQYETDVNSGAEGNSQAE
eukprot:IDg13572t1